MKALGVDPILYKCYLRKKGDEGHCLYMTCRKLIIQFKGRQQVFDLHAIKNLRVTPKKLIILLVAGGIGTCFSMLALSMGWYHYQLNLFSIFGFFAVMYYGWMGKEALEIQEGKFTHLYLLWRNIEAIKKSAQFIRKYRFHQMRNPQIIFHVTEQSSWEQQLTNEHYVHPTLEQEGFIHASNRAELIETFQRYFTNPGAYILLLIDESQIEAKVEHEYVASRKADFPHIFGPINKTAIRRLVEFESLDNLQYLVEETIPD